MKEKYIRLLPDEDFPDVSDFSQYKAIVAVEKEISQSWRYSVSTWLVDTGCRYMMAWGLDCNKWDDSVDEVNLEKFDFGDIPDDQFVMTTWHENEDLSDVFFFAKFNAIVEDQTFDNLLILHIAEESREDEFRELYKKS